MRRTKVAERFQAPMRIDSIPILGMVLLVLLVLIAWIGIPPPFIHGPALPRARMAAPVLANGVILVVDREGGLHFRGEGAFEHLAPPGISARLREAYAGRPEDHALHLWADRDAAYAHVLTALDAARHAGIRRVEMIVDPPREQDRIR